MKDHSWLYTKKRGNLRTDSRLLGVVAEFAFAVFCVLAGVIGMLWLTVFCVYPEWKIHERYEKTVCTLLDSRIVPRTVLDNQPLPDETEVPSLFEDAPPGGTPEPKRSKFDVKSLRSNLQDVYYLPEMQLKYSVDGVERTNWTSSFGALARSSRFATRENAQEFLARWQKEKNYYCLFNPEDPDQVVIMRDWQWENFFALTIPVSLIFMGLGMMIHVMTLPRIGGSKELAAVQTSTRSRLEGEFIPQGDFPYIPSVADFEDSPGIRLPYRLPMIDSPAWKLGVLSAVTLIWNAGCVIFLTIVACSFLQTLADWLLFCYLLPFLGIGIWLLIHTLVEFRNATVVGPTILEISTFPLFPGRMVRIFLSQGGELPLQWLNVVLVCEEEAVFTHGTNTRREKLRVYQRLVFGEERVDITSNRAFDVEFPLEIPQEAMHSFIAPHNQINWRLIIQGKIGKFPMFERVFPLIVYPEIQETGK